MNWFLASVIVKSDLRKSQLNRRLHLPQNEYLDRSKKIQTNIVESEIFHEANLIACYLPIKNEVMTKNLMEFATNDSKIVAVPKIKEHMMVFQDYAFADQLRKNKFGILENEGQVIQPDEFDLIICPTLAADIHGNRIGYGQGYYDRYLLKAVNAKFVALIFDFQLIDERIIAEPHDVSMDYLCNENELIQVK